MKPESKIRIAIESDTMFNLEYNALVKFTGTLGSKNELTKEDSMFPLSTPTKSEIVPVNMKVEMKIIIMRGFAQFHLK